MIALAQLVAGVGLIYLNNAMRPENAPRAGGPPPAPAIVIPQPEPQPEAPPMRALALAFSGLMLIAVSGVLLSRSPFRMGPGERVFRLVWLGPIGRTFVAVGARRGANAAAQVSAERQPAVARPMPPRTVVTTLPPMPAAPSLAALDARVASLEKWRDSQVDTRRDG
jgi:hypothetical protein